MENSAADAVIKRPDETFVGVQFTRINYKERKGKSSSLSKSNKDFQKMLGLGFIFIVAIYVNETLEACGLWLPDDLGMFSEALNKNSVRVALYAKRSCFGKGSIIFKDHTYFFPNDRNAFSTKIMDYINQPKAVYSIDDLRYMLFSDEKIKEERYIDKLISFLLPSIDLTRKVNTPDDVTINGCRI